MQSQREDFILLITDYVSGHLNEADSENLLRSIQNENALQRELRAQQNLRHRLVQLKPKNPPATLRDSILQKIQAEEEQKRQEPKTSARLFYFGIALAAAASLILALVLNSGLFNSLRPAPTPVQIASLEQHLFDLFQSPTSKNPAHKFHNHENLHQFLKEQLSWDLTVPPVQDAELMGLSFSHTPSGDSLPVFMFSLSDHQPFLVIGSPVNELKGRELSADPDAVKACVADDVYYVQNIDGKHVVSWKWGDDWYAGISNHDGKTIAALLPH